jgi:SDR family mycofactocin-dependent oxidoreductase
MAGRVAGKVAFITGAARGQGRSHALRLAQEGADIIAVDLCEDVPTVKYSMASKEDLAETARQVEALDRRVVTAKADVRDQAALATAVDAAVADLGRLDIVVANAGICTWQTWDETPMDVWQDTIDINLTGVWNTLVVGARHLVEAGGGSMIATSSTAGLKGLPFLGPYVAAKHGVVGIVNALANELARYSIRVNTVHPTGVNTPLVTASLGNLDPMLDQNPDLRPLFNNALPVEILEPREISNAVLFLASDESAYVTGVQLSVDAGSTNR